MLKIACAQLDYIIGDFEGNTEQIINSIIKAKHEGADLVCFSELAICGYPPRDFLEFDDFIDRSNASIEKILAYTNDIGVILGAPIKNPDVEGKDLFNAALFIYQNKIQFTYHKTLLPTYDIFDEYRYFEPGKTFDIFEFKGYKIAITICEDIWNIGNDNPLYTICPMDEIINHSPDFMVNLSASPFSYTQREERLRILKENANKYQLPIFYINQCGAQTELIFDGGSIVMNTNGSVYDEMTYFTPSINVYDVKEVLGGNSNIMPKSFLKIEKIHDALVMGVKSYFDKLSLSKAMVGLSGGIDSAVTLAITARALGHENTHAVLMPGPFSSDHSVEDAISLSEKLNVSYDIIPIESVYESYLHLLKPVFGNRPFDITEENIQARIRGMILMAMSNKFGYIVLNTSNKSEAAVGYGTLYGDMCGGLSVIGDLYKTEVYELANFMNAEKIIIPINTIEKPPSAELRPDQFDSDSLPDYDILDQILFLYIEKRKGPEEIAKLGFDRELVRKVLRLVNMNEFKRYQTAPVLRVSPKAFGIGRRMPIVGKYLS